jgi:hypothetical protein
MLWKIECESTNGALILLYLIISMIFVFIFHKLSQTPDNSDLAVFMYFVQMCLLFLGTEAWLSWLSVFNMVSYVVLQFLSLHRNSYKGVFDRI